MRRRNETETKKSRKFGSPDSQRQVATMAGQRSFEELLALAREGDAQAMADIIAGYEREVRTIARLRLGPALRPYLDSVDLVQSVHHSVMLGLKNDKYVLERPEDLIALAATIVRRKAARHWQRMQRQRRDSGGGAAGDSLPDLLVNLSTREAAPEDDTDYKDLIAKVCAQLDPADRQLLELHLEGYSTADVARMLEQNPDVLRVKLSRLRSRLRSSGVLSNLI
jgi:RNA polymerase sigma-70 factor (ECF subfamily)